MSLSDVASNLPAPEDGGACKYRDSRGLAEIFFNITKYSYLVGPGGHCSPRHRVPFTSSTSVKGALIYRPSEHPPRHMVPFSSRYEGSKCVA